jgi:NADPH:quinone reductase-like Zn-dependent oxidoreductase
VYSAIYDQRFSMMLASIEPRDLDLLAGWIVTGRIRPVIDRRYSLREVPDALRYLETGRARGKVIIDVRAPDESATGAATAASR